jgi:hypothetical protein
MALKPGERLTSAACATQVVVVRPPSDGAAALTCAGVPMVSGAAAAPASPKAPPAGGQALAGKRYEDSASGLEVLCTRGGGCIPEVSGRALTVKEAKPLPSSD